MDKSNGVRKYDGSRHRWQRARYLLHRLAIVPAKWFTALLFMGGMFIVFGSLYAPNPFGLLVGTVIACRYGWAVWYVNFEAPEGTVWNPARPDENIILPDAEFLVRPSSSSAAQPAELLRAAQETAKQKPEELLRAAE